MKTDFADGGNARFTVGKKTIPFEEAVQFLRSKIPMEKDEWKELEKESCNSERLRLPL